MKRKKPHRHMEVSHSYAHLEPNTPLSSSSTVLSLFCSSFSRSLASASSCQWKTDSYYIITVHTVAPHWLDLWISASTGVGVSAGWGEGGRRQAQRSNLPRWWPPPRSACHLCRATFWIQMGGSPQSCDDDCSPRHETRCQQRSSWLVVSRKGAFFCAPLHKLQ